MQCDNDTDSSSVPSTSSSDISVGERYAAKFRSFNIEVETPRSLQDSRYLYSIHTYLVVEPRGAVVNKVFLFLSTDLLIQKDLTLFPATFTQEVLP